MEKRKTIVEYFLSTLNHDQKGVIREYFRLITDPDLPRKNAITRISEIWSLAEEDPTLLSWLEAIDFIIADQDDEESNETINNRRAYLSEYLGKEINFSEETPSPLPKAWTCKFLEGLADGEDMTLLLKCPDGKNHVFVSVKGAPLPCQEQPFSEEVCEQCHFKLSEHQIVHATKAAVT
jgi:hypothetical protein